MLEAPRMGDEAIEWAKDHSASQNWYRLCLIYVRSSFGVPKLAPNAGAAWDNAVYKHLTTDADTIPRGVPIFWETSAVEDHVALSLGGGLCISTDVVVAGRADIVTVNSITSKWNCALLGWTEDINNYRIVNGVPTSLTLAADELNGVGVTGKSLSRGAVFF